MRSSEIVSCVLLLCERHPQLLGLTSLQVVADQGFVDLLEEYLGSGKEATPEALHSACGKGRVGIALQLLDAHLDANTRDVGQPWVHDSSLSQP